jgi:iron complex outermembrane receptor protein
MPTSRAILWCLPLVAVATAAAQVPDSAKQLPEIKVTVTRTPSTLSRLGAAVTVVDSAAIHRERLSTKLDEALAYVPGVVAEDRNNYSVDERISIRGFGSRSNFGLRGIKVLLDGVPQTLPDGQSALNNVNLSLVDRLEVLRGGASSLYGNASGGVLSLTTSPVPAAPWLLSGRAEGGTFGSSKEELVTGARIGTLGGTLAASRFYTDGFRQQSATDERRLNAGVDWSATASTTLTLRFAAADDPRARNPGALTATEYAINSDSASAVNIRRGADKAVTQNQLAVGMRHDAGRLHVDATIFGLTRNLQNPLATPPPAPASASEGTWNAIDRELGGVRASSTIDLDGPSVTAGVDVQSLRDNRTNRRSVAGVITDTLLLDQTERVSEKAAFTQLIVPVGGNVTLRAGARHDINDFSVADHFLGDGDASAARTMAATSGNGGVAVRLGSRFTAWSDIATVFETPTTTELANRPDGSGVNPDLNPQRSVTAEVGVRGITGRITIDAAVYHTTTHDAIVPFNEVGGRTYYDNAGATRTQGAELGLRVQLRAGLALLATWTFTDAIFTDYKIVSPASTDTLDGHQLAGLPRSVGRIGIRGAIGRGLTIDVDQGFSSSMYGDDDNKIAIDGWGAGVTGARLTWQGDVAGLSWQPFVAAINLFDRRYVGSVTSNGAGGRVFEPAAGRTIYVGAALTARGK